MFAPVAINDSFEALVKSEEPRVGATRGVPPGVPGMVRERGAVEAGASAATAHTERDAMSS